MSDCLFCKIIQKEIPSTSVYEDADVYAFLDIHPVNLGHVLVVPKQHSEGLLDTDPVILGKWILVIQKIAKAMKTSLGIEGFNLEQNDGAVAGQVIPHVHMHIIPRFVGDGLRHRPGKEYKEGEAQALAEKIKQAL